MALAVTRYTPHTSRSFRKAADYLGFPADITPQMVTRPSRRAWVERYLEAVDIVHCHNQYRHANGWALINPDARWLMHQHGRIPRDSDRIAWRDHQAADAKRGAMRYVSTLNLLSYVDGDAERWIPAPIDLERYAALPREKHEIVTIGHSPTRRDYKRTELLIATVNSLNARGYRCGLDIIEGVTHAESLARKARCHIIFDQIHLCYGNSGLEGMAMGLPVVCGMDAETHATVERVVGYRPYVTADDATLETVLLSLVIDEAARKEAGTLGRCYIEERHAAPVVAAKMAAIYEAMV